MLAVIGDVVQDVVIWLQEPMRAATDTRSEISMRRGGSAANVAAFAGHRYPTRFIGCVGDDLGGIAVTTDLEGRGVDVKMQVEGDTGMIVVLIDEHGERMMFPSRGASGRIGPVRDAWLEDVDLLHLTGYSLDTEPAASNVVDAAHRVKERGGKLSLDISSVGMVDSYGLDRFRDLVKTLGPDVISANENEAEFLGLATADGPGAFLVNLGETLLLARAGKKATRVFRGPNLIATVPVKPADKVRDMTGAGDAFNAGFLTSYLVGGELVAACEAGHALARRVLAVPGASEPDDVVVPTAPA